MTHMTPETVGELKRLIADLPDDMPFRVYSGRVDCLTDFSCVVANGEYDTDGYDDTAGRDVFVVASEN